MLLSVSNIAWNGSENKLYETMIALGYSGLEIAPTKIFGEHPYDCLAEASQWAKGLSESYGISVSSMQSIWFGRKEMLFRSDDEYRILMQYTKKAVDLAEAVGCGNLVFGCPSSRKTFSASDAEKGVLFFRELGEYAASKGACIGMEANPPIYNTDYITDTGTAIELVKEVDSTGFKLNLDIGTMIENDESPDLLKGNVKYINHVHISEPYLAPVKERALHRELRDVLINEGYNKYISIEMKPLESTDEVLHTMNYIREVFL